MMEAISFLSDGLLVRGNLHVPQDGGGPRPGVVLTGPFTGTKEQVVGTYASMLAERGFVALAIDHRNFGESEGEPRQHENSAGKLQDLIDATSFLASYPGVDADRLACVGVCLGGSYALVHSAFDPRIRAVSLVAGGYNNPLEMQRGMGAENYRRMMAEFSGVAQRQAASGEVEYIPAVAQDGEAAMPGEEPWAYYGTERSASPGWMNRVTRLSIRSLLTFDATTAVEFLPPTPMLVVHGTSDAYCSPEAAKRLYDRNEGIKDILWLDAKLHIDLYDDPAYVVPAADRTAAWFDEHLPGRVRS